MHILFTGLVWLAGLATLLFAVGVFIRWRLERRGICYTYTVRRIDQGTSPEEPPEDDDLHRPIVQTVNRMLAAAIQQGAEEIHFLPAEHHMDVKFLIDGYLQQEEAFPKHLQAPLLTRVKLMADVPYYKRDKPQVGKIVCCHEGQWFEMPLKVVSGDDGEKITIRLLPCDPPARFGTVHTSSRRSSQADSSTGELRMSVRIDAAAQS